MKKLGWVMGLTLAVIACGTAGDMVGDMMDVPDAGAQAPPATFVGYSTAKIALSVGLFDTYAACHADFGNTSRICTVAEVLATTDLPAPPPERVYVVQTLESSPACWGGNDGTFLLPSGIFTSSNCSNPLALACCRVD